MSNNNIKERISDEIINNAIRTIEDDGIVLLGHHKFYAYLLIELNKFATTEIDIAAVSQINGKNNLYFHPINYPNLVRPERLGTLIHELDHLILKHPLIMVKHDLDPKIWNIATDIYINPTVPNNEHIRLPKGVWFPEKFNLPRGLSSNEYYQELKKDPTKIPQDVRDQLYNNSKGQGHFVTGEGSSDNPNNQNDDQNGNSENIVNSHSQWEKSKGSLESSERAIERAIERAYHRAQGNVPGHIKRFVEDIIEPKIDWKNRFNYLWGKYLKGDFVTTWKKESRRLGPGFKGHRKTNSLSICIMVDTSISIKEENFAEFAGHIHAMYRARNNVEIFVIECDATVKKTYKYNGKIDTLFKEGLEGGGTDFRPPFTLIKEERKEFDLIVYLTDGFGTAPSYIRTPTIWLLTDGGTVPVDVDRQPITWGEIVYMDGRNPNK